MGVSKSYPSVGADGQAAPIPSAVEVLGDAFVSVARRPMAVVPVVALDAIVAAWIATESTSLTAPLGGEMPLGPMSLGLVAGFLAPALLPFGGLQPSWAESNVSGSGGSDLSWQIGFVAVAAVLGVLFLTRVAALSSGTDGHPAQPWTLQTAAERCVRMGLLAIAVPLFVSGPVLVAAWAVGAAEATEAPVVAVLIGFGGTAFFFLRFSFDALLTERVSPLEALARSWRVVSRRPGAALRLLALGACIAAGTRVLWLSLIETPAGLAVGVVGNGLITTALALARMNFYRAVSVEISPGRISTVTTHH